MTTISARVILKSQHAVTGDTLTTMLLRYPRCIHSELMTHRVFSRNSASSRAIPVKKMIESVIADPFVPMFWGKNQKGMQAGEEHTAPVNIDEEGVYLAETREGAWLTAMDHAVVMACAFDDAGYHKQIVNRLLEPFMHITVLVSSTTWENWDRLRIHKDAEPHINLLAKRMKIARDEATVQILLSGEWHMPFVGNWVDQILPVDELLKLSVARCASTSYKTVDGFDMTLERAREIYDKMLNAEVFHASPFEHVAQADTCGTQPLGLEPKAWQWSHPEEHGNFETAFRQLRRQLPGGR